MQHVRYNPNPHSKKFLIGFARFTLMIPGGSDGGPDPWTPRPATPLNVHEDKNSEKLYNVLTVSL